MAKLQAHTLRQVRGLTLIEVLIATAVMGMTALSLATLADAVRVTDEHVTSQGDATQHARVAIDRVNATVRQAWANEKFPGVIVFSDQVSGWRFPDTAVVWYPDPELTDGSGNLLYPDGKPANPDGLPLFRELKIFCPNPADPSELLEITVPDDTSVVPADLVSLAGEIEAIKADATATRVQLTNLLRTAEVTEVARDAQGRYRGAIRFEVEYRPTESEWTQFQAGNLAWNAIRWPQSLYGKDSGFRQVWLRTELQLNLQPNESEEGSDANSHEDFAVPYFGSAAVYYPMRKSPPP
jgi:prepilin-type N-terminal cleavage/methylation domain-containing protein